MRIVVALAAVAALALTLSGAGTAAPAREAGYAQQIQPVERQLSGVLVALKKLAAKSVVFPAPPDAARKAAAEVVRQRTALQSAGSRLAAIKAPARIRPQHTQLRTATHNLYTQLAKSLKRLHQGWLIDAGKLPRLSGAQQLDAAIAAMIRKGYTLGSGG
jgi:hypothetical protein